MSEAGFPEAEVRCAECHTLLAPGQDREETSSGVFCRVCYDNLAGQVHSVVSAQGEGINYPLALVGGLAGGVAGATAWWGFTVVTNISFGLIAIIIGIAVGKGIVMATGKRAVSLQVMSVTISVCSYFAATYMVIRSFVNESPEMVEAGITLPLVPDLALAIEVIGSGFEMFDLIFLGIVVWEAWRVTAPLSLDGS